MKTYYNRTSGPLPLTLRDGSVVLIPPKKKAEVSDEQDASTAIVRALAKGLIVDVTPPPLPEEKKVETKAEEKKQPTPDSMPAVPETTHRRRWR
jgi:hypothetical protein